MSITKEQAAVILKALHALSGDHGGNALLATMKHLADNEIELFMKAERMLEEIAGVAPASPGVVRLSDPEAWDCAWAGARALGGRPRDSDHERVRSLLAEEPHPADGPWEKAVRQRAQEIVKRQDDAGWNDEATGGCGVREG